MEKVYEYKNCTVKVLIPETNNDKRIHKATEDFLRRVIEEREAIRDER